MLWIRHTTWQREISLHSYNTSGYPLCHRHYDVPPIFFPGSGNPPASCQCHWLADLSWVALQDMRRQYLTQHHDFFTRTAPRQPLALRIWDGKGSTSWLQLFLAEELLWDSLRPLLHRLPNSAILLHNPTFFTLHCMVLKTFLNLLPPSKFHPRVWFPGNQLEIIGAKRGLKTGLQNGVWRLDCLLTSWHWEHHFCSGQLVTHRSHSNVIINFHRWWIGWDNGGRGFLNCIWFHSAPEGSLWSSPGMVLVIIHVLEKDDKWWRVFNYTLKFELQATRHL